MNFKKFKVYKRSKWAFTLLECLITLFILAIIMQTLIVSINHYRRIDQKIRDERTLDWQHFTLLMEKEFEHFTIKNVTADSIQVFAENDPGVSTFIVLKNHKIYRSPGHQPYLYQVQSWHISDQDPFITISVHLTNNQVFSHTFHAKFNRVDDLDGS